MGNEQDALLIPRQVQWPETIAVDPRRHEVQPLRGAARNVLRNQVVKEIRVRSNDGVRSIQGLVQQPLSNPPEPSLEQRCGWKGVVQGED